MVFVCFVLLGFRFGEASHPGPCGLDREVPSFEVAWTLDSEDGDIFGCINPSGISNKQELFRGLPAGWWGIAESQASHVQLKSFRSSVKNGIHSKFHFVAGAPAPLRPGSDTAGSWTGVLQQSSFPIREVTLDWPQDVWSSGRVCVGYGSVRQVGVLHATIYCPPRGPTYPDARALSEQLLEPVTRELVVSRTGCRIISGDFNCPPGGLHAHRLWEQYGWIEIQSLMQQRYGLTPVATCKDSSMPDQLWISPELQPYICDITFTDWFPGHRSVLARVLFPHGQEWLRHWDFPPSLPWEAVDKDKLASLTASFRAPDWTLSPTEGYKKWCGDVEKAVFASAPAVPVRKGGCHRGETLKPRLRPAQAPIPKTSREGEAAIAHSFLGRGVQLWFQQVRRFESLLHAMKNTNPSEGLIQVRSRTWQSIRQAKGFRNGFVSWWRMREVQTQGVPSALPVLCPDRQVLILIAAEFRRNYEKFEQWHVQQRRRLATSRMHQAHEQCFKVVRNDTKGQLDTLVDECAQEIVVHGGSPCLVTVAKPFPQDHVIGWQINGEPAQVRSTEGGYVVESDLLLCTGQILTCFSVVPEIWQIQDRLAQLWSQRWSRHQDVPEGQWNRILDFIDHCVPRGSLTLPSITYEQWIATVKNLKLRAARGPDGWSRLDLLSLPRHLTLQMIQLFETLEAGHEWPQQLLQALIHVLEKKQGASKVNDFRPITLLCLPYRIWASLRTHQLLAHLSTLADDFQCGFTVGRQASDLWYLVQADIEVAGITGARISGVVGDLVKAYNLLPRRPAWRALEVLGVPSSFLNTWQLFLEGLERRFVVRQSCGDSLGSVTGFPEGCPLSCCAMHAIDIVWHAYQKRYASMARSMSYVDNLELISAQPSGVLHALGVLREFCTVLDVELDEQKLYGWANNTSDRQVLRHFGLSVEYSARDVGGQMNYGNKKHISVLVARLKSLVPSFQALRRAPLTIGQKILCISGGLWPRGLHGCEGVCLGQGHFHMLRSKVMSSLRWDRAGASPLVRPCLFYTTKLDPEFYQFVRVLRLFRHQCVTSLHLRQLWEQFLQADVKRTVGPFAKLQEQLCRVGWHIDKSFDLWLTCDFRIPFLVSSEEVIDLFAEHYWRQAIAKDLAQRHGYHDLQGFSLEPCLHFDQTLTNVQKELIMIVREGAFFTGDMLSKYDPKVSHLCPTCGQLDTPEHRYISCPKYADIHALHAEVLAKWHDLPASLALHGLTSENPYRELRWRALNQLEHESVIFHGQVPVVDDLHIFTDGTCDNPSSPSTCLAAWAIVSPNLSGIVASGGVPGVLQTTPRAELFAALQAVVWSQSRNGIVHLWSDCAYVVEGFRVLLNTGTFAPDISNQDLWRALQEAVSQSLADYVCHKVSAHEDPANTSSPLEDWALEWNSKADFAARVANQNRPLWFSQIQASFIDEIHQSVELLGQIAALHLDVAEYDVAGRPSVRAPVDDEEEIIIDRVIGVPQWHIATLSTERMSEPSVGNKFSVQTLDCFSRWVYNLEAQSERHCDVTFLELFFGFRVFCFVSEGWESLSSGRNPFHQTTCAAELRIFRQLFRFWVQRLGLSMTYRRTSLSEVGVVVGLDAVMFPWPLDVEQEVLRRVRQFVGRRPIQNCQGLSRPCPPLRTA